MFILQVIQQDPGMQQRWDDASAGFGAATHVGDTDSCRSRMFDRVRSEGGSSSEGVGARRWSATVPVSRNRSYTSHRNRAVGRRLLRTRWGGGERGFFYGTNNEIFWRVGNGG
ncbi:uncharacterized protein DS421_1g25130 [Arachis hypogaea]|nr:uncharacterized protein DS421_1g25130 [Arachis hypogaea]